MIDANYNPPSLVFRQEITANAEVEAGILASCIVAPFSRSHSHDANEAYLGTYDAASGNTFASFPEHVAGASIRTADASIYVTEPLVQYASASFAGTATDGVLTGGNKVRSASSVFKTGNGSTATTQDVKVGDVVDFTLSDTTYRRTVMGVEADIVEADLPAEATAAAGNAGTAGIDVTGTFVGLQDDTYVLTVTQGGKIGTGTAVFHVYTTKGTDASHTFEAATAGTVYLGTMGVRITFTDEETFVAGDVYTIAATAAGSGAYKTLVLSEALNEAVFVTNAAFTAKLMTLHDEDAVTVPQTYTSITSSVILVASGAQVYYKDVLKPLAGGKLNVAYTEDDNVSFASRAFSVTSDSAADVLFGAGSTSPLATMVKASLANANGQTVYFISCDGTAAGYTSALARLESDQRVYSIVPYNTDDPAVVTAARTHVLSMSNEYNCKWRTLVLGNPAKPLQTLPETEGTATVTNVPPYTGNVVVDATSASFVTWGIKEGDLFNANGESYEISSVVSETRLILKSGPAAALTVAVVYTITHNLALLDYRDSIGEAAQVPSHRRVYSVWANGPSFNGQPCDNAIVAAAVAGLRSGVAPHQPITFSALAGITCSNTYDFNSEDLRVIMSNGVMLVQGNANQAGIIKAQLSTDMSNLKTREQSITTNSDSVSRMFFDAIDDLYGSSNVTNDVLLLIKGRLTAAGESIMSLTYPQTIGRQILGMEIAQLQRHPTLEDKILVRIVPTWPVPLNNFDVTMVI